MKKTICLILTLILIFSALNFISVAAKNFTDLDGHWGFEYINTLVNDGTINGYEDGTFRPNSTVSRAEFVKMIGKGSTQSSIDYIDVPKSHWGYDYILFSGMDIIGNKFYPDKEITRGEVLNLIWKRCGSVKNVLAPAIITNQQENKDAVAWGYTYGLMTGDDGVNLRLNDTLTRAEASALIVRSRSIDENTDKKDFINTVSDDVLKSVFNSQRLFDREYDPNSKITNGEMARAVLRFGERKYDLTYKNISATNELNCEYGTEYYVVRNECMADCPNTIEFVNKNATVSDTIVEMCYNLTKLIASTVKFETNISYDNAKKVNDTYDKYLSFAATNRILFNAENEIDLDSEITMKEFACILLQLDEIVGTQTSYDSNGKLKNEKLNTMVSTYPANYQSYKAIISSVPINVYAQSISDADAKDMYTFATIMRSMFINPLKEMKTSFSKKGADVELTYYPLLVTNPEPYFIYRVKCNVKKADNILMSTLCENKLQTQDISLNTDDEFFMDIKIKLPMGDLVLFYDDAEIVKIIK